MRGFAPERHLHFFREAIEQDAGDPDFLSNLSRLGQVRVDHHMQHVRPVGSAVSWDVALLTRLFIRR